MLDAILSNFDFFTPDTAKKVQKSIEHYIKSCIITAIYQKINICTELRTEVFTMFKPKYVSGDSKQLMLFISIYLFVLATAYLSTHICVSISVSLAIWLSI